jgi:hypothetical protein
LVVVVVAGGVWWAIDQRFLTVKQVAVVTLVRVEPDVVNETTITQAANRWRGRWLWVDTTELRQRIKEVQPAVDRVEVSVSWPDQLRVELLPRVPLCQIVTTDGTYLIDRDGVVFASLDQPAANVPRLQAETKPQLGKTVSASGAVLGLAVISSLRGVEPGLKEARLADGQLTFSMQNNMTVIMPDSGQANKLIPEMKVLWQRFEEDKKFPKQLDMRFERPVMKW